MFRSSSFRSSQRIDHEAYACSAPANSWLRKAHSLILNSIDVGSGSNSDAEAKEMYEFVPHTSSEETLSSPYPSDVSASDNDRTMLPSDEYQRSMSHEYRLPGCRTLAKWKKILRSCRHERTNVDRRKNNGYLMVEKDATGFVLVPKSAMDQQDDITDQNRFHRASSTPGFRHEFDAEATRSGVECEHWHTDSLITHSATTTTASTSSTNSSNTEYKDIDRSILADTDYVRAQQIDLESLTLLEVRLSKEASHLRQDIDFTETTETVFQQLYEDAAQRNRSLKQQLKAIKDEHDRLYAPWSCTLCTYLNDPCFETQQNICQMCESPSPLKQIMLVQ